MRCDAQRLAQDVLLIHHYDKHMYSNYHLLFSQTETGFAGIVYIMLCFKHDVFYGERDGTLNITLHCIVY